MKPHYIKFLPIVAIICLGAGVYSDIFHNSFHFDDYPEIVNNVSIQDLHNITDIWSFWPTRFIANLSFALNFYWGQLNVAGYHLFSLLIHLGASIMAWWLALLTLSVPSLKKEKISDYAGWIAFFAGLIFLVHPLQTQPINYIYQRATLWLAFFYLSSLALYVKARLMHMADPSSRRVKWYFAASLAMAALAMFSKEIAISLPFAVLFYEGCFFRKKERRSWPWVLPFFMVALLLPLTWWSVHPEVFKGTKQEVENYAGGITIKQYFYTQPKVLVAYLKLLFVPIHQSVDYDFPLSKSIFEIPVILSLLLLMTIVSIAIKMLDKYKVPAFGVLLFFITLMPESSLWPNKDVIFEHRLYLPMMGFGIFLSSVMFYFFQGARKSLAIRALFLIVGILSVLAYERNKVWRDELTLWDDAVHQSPQCTRAYLNRGAAYQKIGNLDAALADYNMVIGLGPVDAVTLSNRGTIFRKKGHNDLALANFNLAIQVNSSFAGTYVNRALLYQDEGKIDLALADFSHAITLIPHNAAVYMGRGLLYEKYGNLDLAIADFSHAIAIAPDNVEYHGTRAGAYFMEKQYDKTWEDVHAVEKLGGTIKSPYLNALKKVSGGV